MKQATIIPLAVRRLKRLTLRLPPPHLFEELLGFCGNRRFFALTWSRAVRRPILNDGLMETLGESDPYRVWRYNSGVIAALAEFNLGDALETADHWLLVDRKARTLYVGTEAEVHMVLDYQRRGMIELMAEPTPARKPAAPASVPGEGALVPFKRYKKPLFFDIDVLHELEAWLEKNIG